MSKDIPDWAYERVAELHTEQTGCYHRADDVRALPWAKTFARYIMEHEEEPKTIEEEIAETLKALFPISFERKSAGELAEDARSLVGVLRLRNIEIAKGGNA